MRVFSDNEKYNELIIRYKELDILLQAYQRYLVHLIDMYNLKINLLQKKLQLYESNDIVGISENFDAFGF